MGGNQSPEDRVSEAGERDVTIVVAVGCEVGYQLTDLRRLPLMLFKQPFELGGVQN